MRLLTADVRAHASQVLGWAHAQAMEALMLPEGEEQAKAWERASVLTRRASCLATYAKKAAAAATKRQEKRRERFPKETEH